jgi:hypothetical protein
MINAILMETEELREPKIPKGKCEGSNKLDRKQEGMRVWIGFKRLRKDTNSHLF